MVDDLYTGDLDPTSATTSAELAALLRTVHLRADKPSLRALAARTRHDPTPLSKTVVSEVLKGVRFPRKGVMVSFLRACGEHDDRIEAWRRAWDRIAASREVMATRTVAEAPSEVADASVSPDSEASVISAARDIEQLRHEVNRLSDENERLRRQMGVADHSAVAAEIQADQAPARRARGPEVRRRELARQLRSLRYQRGLTIEDVAKHLFCSSGKVSRMENGFRSGTLQDVRDLCDLYTVSGTQRDHMMELARQSKQHGWWQDYDVPFSTYIGLEADAASIKSYHCAVVPGLLQTADYARAIVNVTGQARKLVPEAIEQRVQMRLTRQRILTRPDPPELWAVLDEAVLHRTVGGAAVMAAQLDRLMEISWLGNVNVEVIPYSAGCHPGIGGAFDILGFDSTLPDIVYIEGLFGVVYVEKPHDIDRFNEIFRSLHEQALNQEKSREQIAIVRRGLAST